MNLWQPTSGCGPHCLAHDEPARVGVLRRAARLSALLGVVLATGLLAPLLPLLAPRARDAAARTAARAALRALGVRVAWRGSAAGGPALVVANHVSWLDILVLMAHPRTMRIVAKQEVRRWPVVGLVARARGTIFVDRARPRALRGTVAQAARAMAGGATVAVFPEGTTSCGGCPTPFRPAFFQAAVDAGARVVPLTLRYRTAAGATGYPAFIGEETLLDSLRRVLAIRGLEVRAGTGAAIHPGAGASRRVLAGLAERAVGGTASAPWWPVPAPARVPTPAAAPTPVLAPATTPPFGGRRLDADPPAAPLAPAA